MHAAYLDIHILQTVPPSNLNRDDTGAPKSAIYGGVRRARVSSQAWKRATRKHFSEDLDTADVGVRTKRVVELIGARIRSLDPEIGEQAAIERASLVLGALGIGLESPRAKKGDVKPVASKYLVFFSNRQLDRMAALAVSARDGVITKNAAKEAADMEHGVDVALFGRMVADAADLNVDAAVQVAHAISTHAVETEFDYYTAVDDENERAEESGAGMIGTIEFASSTLYRYAAVDLAQLRMNLGDDDMVGRAVEAFVRGFIASMPTGKQNTFGNRTLPDGVVVMARADQPVSLVGAFEEPVPSTPGQLRTSCERLARYAADVTEGFGTPPEAAWVVRVGERTSALESLGERVTLDELVRRSGAVARGESEGAA